MTHSVLGVRPLGVINFSFRLYGHGPTPISQSFWHRAFFSKVSHVFVVVAPQTEAQTDVLSMVSFMPMSCMHVLPQSIAQSMYQVVVSGCNFGSSQEKKELILLFFRAKGLLNQR